MADGGEKRNGLNREGVSMLTVEERDDLVVLEQAGLLGTGLAEVAYERGSRIVARAIVVSEAGLHVEVRGVAESRETRSSAPINPSESR